MKSKLFFVLIFIFCQFQVIGQLKSWNGSISSDWFHPSNWTPSGVPISTDSIVINGSVPNNAVINNFGAVGRVLVFNGSSVNPLLTINSGTGLILSNASSHTLVIKDGILLNHGTLSSTQTGVGTYRAFAAINMLSNGTLQNHGSVLALGGINDGLRMALSTVENHGILTCNGYIGARVSNASSAINNLSGATLNLNGTSKGAQYIAGDFINNGIANIMYDVEIDGSESDWILEICSKTTFSGLVSVSNSGSIINKGFLINNGSSILTNNEGIVKNTGNGSVVNQRIKVNDLANRWSIFEKVATTNHEVTGIYTDTLLTNSAGNYVFWSNIFEPTLIPVGVHTLFAKIITYFPECTYSVPFTFKKFGTRRYVSNTGAGNFSGDSWANASSDLQLMINEAEEGDSIFVKAGVYLPLKDVNGNLNPSNNRTKSFFLKTNVSVFGGFAGTESSVNQRNLNLNKTIFSGDLDNNDIKDVEGITQLHSDIVGNNSYHVVVSAQGGANTRLDGVIITAGNANNNSSFTYVNRTFADNVGGGLVADLSSLKINNCMFLGNKASTNGGAWLSERALITISKTVFKGNNTSGSGGALHISTSGGLILKNSYLIENTSSSSGGAMSLRCDSVELDNSLFISNVSNSFGGVLETSGVTNIKATNSVFYANRSSSIGGGAFNLSQSSFINLRNSIMWANLEGSTPRVIRLVQSAGASYSNSLVQGSGGSSYWQSGIGIDGGGNIELNPLFLNVSDPDGADNFYFTSDDGFSLTSCSPAINIGNNIFASSNDILNANRPINTIVDMGAFEFTGASTIPPNASNLQLSQNNVVCGTSVDLLGTCSSGNIIWFTQALGGTALITNTVTPGITTTYFAECDAGNGCVSLSRTSVTLNVQIVAEPTNIQVSVTYACTGNPVSYSASCLNGTVTWYRSTGGSWTQISTSSTYNTTYNSVYSYSVACVTSVNCKSLQINAPSVARVVNPTGLSLSSSNICSAEELILSGNCSGGILKWFTAASGGSEIGTGSPFSVFPTIATTYYAECVGNGTCKSSRLSAGSVGISSKPAIPISVGVNNTLVCPGASVELTASCQSGSLIWFNQPTGGSPLGNGSPYSVVVNQTLTFYAACINVGCVSNRAPTSQVVVNNVQSNVNLTGSIVGFQELKSSNTITSTGIVSNTAIISLKANNSITLLPLAGSGFKVESGAVFEAKIESISPCL